MPGANGNVPKAYLGGTWKDWNAVQGKLDGTWKLSSDVYMKHNGEWKKVWVRLTAPTNGSTSLSDVTATISWTPGVGQEGYKLYRNNVYVKDVPANATQTTDTLPALQTTYTYTVSAFAGPTETEKISCGAGVSQGVGTPSSSTSINRDWGYSNSTWDGQQILFYTSCTAVTNATSYQWSLDNGSTAGGTEADRDLVFGMNQDQTFYVRWRAYRTYLGVTYYGAWSNTNTVYAGRPLTRNAAQNFDYNKTVRFDETIGETVNFTGGFGTVIDSYEFREVDAVGSSLLANSVRRVTFRRPSGAGGDIAIPYGSSTTSGTGDDGGNYRQGPFTNYVDGFYGVSTFGSWSVASTPYVTYKLRFTGRSIAQVNISYSIT
jgi:hypothetical protein